MSTDTKKSKSEVATTSNTGGGLKIVDFSNKAIEETISLKPEPVKKKDGKKAIAYLTGGLDSAALLLFLQDQPYNMDIRGVAISLRNGKNQSQLDAVEYMCKKIGAEFVQIKINSDNIDDVYLPSSYANYLIEYACQEQIKDIWINCNNDEGVSFEHCNYNTFNTINMEARKLKKVVDAGIPDIQFNCPLNGQSKDAIIGRVLGSGKIDITKLNKSQPADEKIAAEAAYIRKLGFTLAHEKDPTVEKKGNGK